MKYKYQHKTSDDSLTKRKSKPKTNTIDNCLTKQKHSLFFTALSKHAPGAGSPRKEKKHWQRTKQAMTHTNKHTFTHTRKVTIRFHLFDKAKTKRLFQNKNKASRGTVRKLERESERAREKTSRVCKI